MLSERAIPHRFSNWIYPWRDTVFYGWYRVRVLSNDDFWSEIVKNKLAKKLMMETCVRVNRLGEVSWMNKISIVGSDLSAGSTIIHSEYLGLLDESAHGIAQKSYAMNFPVKDCVEVF